MNWIKANFYYNYSIHSIGSIGNGEKYHRRLSLFGMVLHWCIDFAWFCVGLGWMRFRVSNVCICIRSHRLIFRISFIHDFEYVVFPHNHTNTQTHIHSHAYTTQDIRYKCGHVYWKFSMWFIFHPHIFHAIALSNRKGDSKWGGGGLPQVNY